jgi:hypothetical protein
MAYAVKQRNALNQLAPRLHDSGTARSLSLLHSRSRTQAHDTPSTLFILNVYRFPQAPIQPTKHNENKLRVSLKIL